MKKVFAMVALVSFMFSTAAVDFNGKDKKKPKTEKAATAKKATAEAKKECGPGEKKSCCSKK